MKPILLEPAMEQPGVRGVKLLAPSSVVPGRGCLACSSGRLLPTECQRRAKVPSQIRHRCSVCSATVTILLSRRSQSQRYSKGRGRDVSDEGEDAVAKVLPFVAAAVFGLLAFTPALLVGSAALSWSVLLAGSVVGLLYFSVALPLLITVLTLGGVLVLPLLAANFFVATFIASLVAAGAAGLLVWVALGNPLPALPFQDLLPWSGEAEPEAADAEAKSEDPFQDWDRRFANSFRRIRLVDLSADSKLAAMRAYIAQARIQVLLTEQEHEHAGASCTRVSPCPVQIRG